MARIYLERAEIMLQEGQIENAAADYESALLLGHGLYKADPTRKPYGLVLGESLRGDEKLRRYKGDLVGADTSARERQELAHQFLSKDLEDVRFQHLLEQEP